MTEPTNSSQLEPNDIPAAASIIRSEEQAHVHMVSTPQTRLRIQKVIVTEERTITVQVRREELRIAEYPATETWTDDTGSLSATPVTVHDDDFTLVLSEEQIDVRTRIVPVERVRITRTRVTTPTDVITAVRREHVDVEEVHP